MARKQKEPEPEWAIDETFEQDLIDDTISHNFGDGVVDDFIKLKNDIIHTHEVAYDNAKQLARAIDMKKGETIYANLTGRFIFGDFIGAFIQEHNLKVKELTIVSLAGNIAVYGLIVALLERGWADKITLILSEYTIAMDKRYSPEAVEYLKAAQEKHGSKFEVYTGRVHAKLVLIETEKGGKVTIHGSANLRSSQAIEQIIIQENAALYDFNYEFCKSLKAETT